MLAYNLKDILSLIPEALPMVKQANLEEEFLPDCKDSVSASYLRVHYLEKVARKAVDTDVKAQVIKAASLHDIKDHLDSLLYRFIPFEKTAAYLEDTYGSSLQDKEAYFEGELGGFGFLGIEKAASTARDLMEQYGDQVTSLEVKRYAGQAWLNKEAAVKALANRYHATKDASFVKVAQIVMSSVRDNVPEDLISLCDTVTRLDKKAGLDLVGFNFYRDALLTKESEYKSMLSVTLNGEQVPYEKIERFGKDRISSTLGKDIGSAITGNPVEDKAMLEALPVDLQRMLQSLLKNV